MKKSELVCLFQCFISGIFIFGMDQQRNIQVTGRDQKHLDASNCKGIQRAGSYAAAGDHLLAKQVQLNSTSCTLIIIRLGSMLIFDTPYIRASVLPGTGRFERSFLDETATSLDRIANMPFWNARVLEFGWGFTWMPENRR